MQRTISPYIKFYTGIIVISTGSVTLNFPVVSIYSLLKDNEYTSWLKTEKKVKTKKGYIRFYGFEA